RRARRAQEIGKRTDRDNVEQAGADENVHEGTLHPEGKHDLGAENTVETSQEYRPRQNAHGGCRGREISSKENHGQVRRANEQDNENREAHRTLSDQKTLHELNGPFGIVHKEAVDARIERASQRTDNALAGALQLLRGEQKTGLHRTCNGAKHDYIDLTVEHRRGEGQKDMRSFAQLPYSTGKCPRNGQQGSGTVGDVNGDCARNNTADSSNDHRINSIRRATHEEKEQGYEHETADQLGGHHGAHDLQPAQKPAGAKGVADNLQPAAEHKQSQRRSKTDTSHDDKDRTKAYKCEQQPRRRRVPEDAAKLHRIAPVASHLTDGAEAKPPVRECEKKSNDIRCDAQKPKLLYTQNAREI